MKPVRLLHEFLPQRGDTAVRSRAALISDGETHTFGRLVEDSNRLAAALRVRGVGRGDRVTLFLDNSWACAVGIFGTLIAGGVFVPVNPQTRADKLEFILRDSGARALIADDRLAPVFLDAVRRLEQPLALLRAGSQGNPAESLDVALAAAEAIAEPAPVIPPDLAAILYTSGTTGTPKGVMQTHQSMVFTVGSLLEYLRLSSDDRVLCVLPLSFDYGLYQLLMTVALGACLVLERSFTFLGQVLGRIRDERITALPAVPTIFAA